MPRARRRRLRHAERIKQHGMRELQARGRCGGRGALDALEAVAPCVLEQREREELDGKWEAV